MFCGAVDRSLNGGELIAFFVMREPGSAWMEREVRAGWERGRVSEIANLRELTAILQFKIYEK